MNYSAKALSINPSVTLSVSAKVEELKKQRKHVVSFCIGEPDFSTPEFINEQTKRALDDGFTKYSPASGILPLKQAVCEKLKKENNLNYSPENIVVTAGAKSAIFHTLFSTLNDGDEVVIPAPYWISYPEMVKLAGGKCVFAETDAKNGHKITAELVDSLITSKTKCLILNSPNNPSGAVYTLQELKEIAEVIVNRDIFVISDEVYEKFLYGDNQHFSIAALNEEIFSRTVTVNSLSKTYSMTGYRVGYLAADKMLAKTISAVLSHSIGGIAAFGQYGAVAALKEDTDYCLNSCRVYEKRRNVLLAELSKTENVFYTEPNGAFYVFADVSYYYGKSYNGRIVSGSEDFADCLLDEGVAVVPGIAFGRDSFIRLSFTVEEDEIRLGMQRFRNFLKKMRNI